MQAKNPKIHVERSFYRSLLALTLPVALQNVISYSVNLMDTLMLGGLGEVALSATSLANQVFFIYTVAIFGVAGGAIVLCSQYWGKKDVDSICRVASLALRISAAAGLLFTLVLFLFPRPVMQISRPAHPICASCRCRISSTASHPHSWWCCAAWRPSTSRWRSTACRLR